MGSRVAFRPHPSRLALAVILLQAWASVQAKPDDTLQPYLFYNVTQDNNLFRTSSNEQTDVFQQAGAGLLLDWKQSRQEVTGRIGASKTVFSKNGALDFSGYDFLGQWNWQLGNHLMGQMGYSKTRSLGSFQDNNVGLTQNTVDQASTFLKMSYSLHPRWRINGTVERSTVDYSSAALKISDNTLDHIEIGPEYLTPKGSRLSAYVARWNGNYPNRQPLLFFTVDNSFKQEEIGVRSTWVVDGKCQLSGRVGQTRRTHKEISQRDFSGLTGSLDGTWQATGKFYVAGTVYRGIGAVNDTYASYSVNDGVRLKPNLLIRPKLKLSAEAYYENRNFKGDPFSLGFRRKDTATGQSLSLVYQPRDWALLNLSYHVDKRDSNLANDFSDQTLSTFVQLLF